MLTMLIRLGMDVNSQDSEGDTPLHWAAFAGNVRGIQVGLTSQQCCHGLRPQAFRPLHPPQVLLQKGAKVMENYQGLTPWEVAAAEPAAFLGEGICFELWDSPSLHDLWQCPTTPVLWAGAVGLCGGPVLSQVVVERNGRYMQLRFHSCAA